MRLGRHGTRRLRRHTLMDQRLPRTRQPWIRLTRAVLLAGAASAAGCGPVGPASSNPDEEPAGGAEEGDTQSEFGSALSATSDLNPTKDAFVRSGTYANTNFGKDVSLTLKGSSSNYNRNDWLTFNISGKTGITSAKLRLFVKSVGAENANTVPAKLFFAAGSGSDNWSETGITWNNVPAAGVQIASLNITGATAGTWIEYDVTSSVKQEGDGAATFMLTTSSTSNRGVNFASREDVNKPILRIT